MFIGKMLSTAWGFPKGTIVLFLGKMRGQFPEMFTLTGRRYTVQYFYVSNDRYFQSSAGPMRGIELGYWEEIE